MKQIFKNIGWFIGMYIANIVVEFDIAVNVVLFFGQPGETISSHFGRSFPNSLFAKFVDKLFFWQRVQSHCQHAALSFHGNPKDDLIPKATAEQRVIQIVIFCFFLFIILYMVFA